MTSTQWNAFCKFKEDYKNEVVRLIELLGYKYCPPHKTDSSAASAFSPEKARLFKNIPINKFSEKAGFASLQNEAAIAGKTPAYSVETPIVYNHAWDDVRAEDEIRLILVGDNPGKNEQLHKNQRYLVGQSGKIADSFFKRNPCLGIDFRKNVIILNKSPIHTAKTKELSYLLKKEYRDEFLPFFENSQIFTVKKTVELQKAFSCPIWIVGYSELREKGLFAKYAEELKQTYQYEKDAPIFLYQHFSMNRFIIDLKEKSLSCFTLEENLKKIGLLHRKEILNF